MLASLRAVREASPTGFRAAVEGFAATPCKHAEVCAVRELCVPVYRAEDEARTLEARVKQSLGAVSGEGLVIDDLTKRLVEASDDADRARAKVVEAEEALPLCEAAVGRMRTATGL